MNGFDYITQDASGRTHYLFQSIYKENVASQIAQECKDRASREKTTGLFITVTVVALSILLGTSLVNAVAMTGLTIYFISSSYWKSSEHYSHQAHLAELRIAELSDRRHSYHA